MTTRCTRALGALGVFVGLFGLYLLTSPGRIDFIDGQYRYEIARSWLDIGEPVIRDPVLRALGASVDARTGHAYSWYNAAPSLTPVPLMWVARRLGGYGADRDRFAFSLTSALFGAIVAALLVVIYGMLGVDLPMSVCAALVFALATQWWPGSVTTFDQNQHAFVLLAALILAWESGRRGSTARALLAGLAGGLLLIYQETYALLLPAIALTVFAPSDEGTRDAPRLSALGIGRDALTRCFAFGAGCCVGAGLFLAYNHIRFGALLQPNRYDAHWPSDPLAGILSLTLSPGRSVFLFSPPLLLLAFGVHALWTRAPVLCTAAGLAAVMHFLFVSNLPFFAGEWAWGPRYLLVLLPLAGLGLPFAMARVRGRSLLVAGVVLGLVVQLMAVSLDHQRFYFERNLAPHFWAQRPWFYFERSQLLARPFELGETLRSGVPAEAVSFAPTPEAQLTYAPFGPPRPQLGAAWARRFAVFHVFRPWPLWMHHIDVVRRPVPLTLLTAACAALVVLGVALLLVALKPFRALDGPAPENAAQRAR
jgi:hypothetical protein